MIDRRLYVLTLFFVSSSFTFTSILGMYNRSKNGTTMRQSSYKRFDVGNVDRRKSSGSSYRRRRKNYGKKSRMSSRRSSRINKVEITSRFDRFSSDVGLLHEECKGHLKKNKGSLLIKRSAACKKLSVIKLELQNVEEKFKTECKMFFLKEKQYQKCILNLKNDQEYSLNLENKLSLMLDNNAEKRAELRGIGNKFGAEMIQNESGEELEDGEIR